MTDRGIDPDLAPGVQTRPLGLQPTEGDPADHVSLHREIGRQGEEPSLETDVRVGAFLKSDPIGQTVSVPPDGLRRGHRQTVLPILDREGLQRPVGLERSSGSPPGHPPGLAGHPHVQDEGDLVLPPRPRALGPAFGHIQVDDSMTPDFVSLIQPSLKAQALVRLAEHEVSQGVTPPVEALGVAVDVQGRLTPGAIDDRIQVQRPGDLILLPQGAPVERQGPHADPKVLKRLPQTLPPSRKVKQARPVTDAALVHTEEKVDIREAQNAVIQVQVRQTAFRQTQVPPEVDLLVVAPNGQKPPEGPPQGKEAEGRRGQDPLDGVSQKPNLGIRVPVDPKVDFSQV